MSQKNILAAIGFLLLAIIAGGLVYVTSGRNQVQSASQAVASSTMTENTASTTVVTPVTTTASATKSSATTSGRPLLAENGITYEVVTTPAEQQQGLSDRSTVPDNYGMLFVFPTDSEPGFWMKDMLVPLDMTWLTDSGTIVSINRDVLPSSYPFAYYPPQPIKYVIETKAGFAAEKGWHVGEQIQLPAPY
jgi:uncharacterized membrane protein (UPF0127 family)